MQQLDDIKGKLARALIGGNPVSIAKAVLLIDGVREAVTTQLLLTLNEECSKLCRRKKPTSLFRKVPMEDLTTFNWNGMIAELTQEAPLLLKMLQCVVARNDSRNMSKVGVAHYPGICTAAAVMLKDRNREMCGLQSLLSLLLYSCHCEKQVISKM